MELQAVTCPVCGLRAHECFDHGDDWKTGPPPPIWRMTEPHLRAGVNEFTEDDPPPYPAGGLPHGEHPYDYGYGDAA